MQNDINFSIVMNFEINGMLDTFISYLYKEKFFIL